MRSSVIYLPTVAEFESDLAVSYGLLENFKSNQFATGLMLVIKNGKQGLSGEAQTKQYENFLQLTNKVGELPVIIMVANLPLADLNFYCDPTVAAEHVSRAIDFTKSLPGRQPLPVVSFHLNTLLNPTEWLAAGATPQARSEFFNGKFFEIVSPALKTLAAYAKQQGVRLKVETTPVPEFGDLSDLTMNSLGNPYPLYSGRGFDQVRQSGLGIVLDICHTHTLFQASQIKPGVDFYDEHRGIFPEDLERLRGSTLLEEVESLAADDVVHLNDGRGKFNLSAGTLYQEGITLGDGEIPSLPKIIRTIVENGNDVVFEINEADYANRPNTRKSIEYFLKYARSN